MLLFKYILPYARAPDAATKMRKKGSGHLSRVTLAVLAFVQIINILITAVYNSILNVLLLH